MSVVQTRMTYGVFSVGPQGVLIDTGHRDDDLILIGKHIELCNYSFKAGVEYVCLPMFKGGRLRS